MTTATENSRIIIEPLCKVDDSSLIPDCRASPALVLKKQMPRKMIQTRDAKSQYAMSHDRGSYRSTKGVGFTQNHESSQESNSSVSILTRMFLPDLGADEHPVDGEEGAEQEGDGERAQHVPVEDVHADEIAYLDPRCHCE